MEEIGQLSGWTTANTSCPHVDQLGSLSDKLPMVDTPCISCGEQLENWVCLTCYDVLCSRYVNAHMAEHSTEKGHPLALSFSDLSVWCFSCDAYIDAQVVNELRPSFEVTYLKKFGVEAPKRSEGESAAKE
ncbi:hypothetical protein O6H91_07G055500 [Diphasiastrum complanatum]|uniref:Uncharacterized protein n=1 Tax=Diphasiastrum complanatum TaxID=34168 RepID=A0ACC2D5T9_DIPCM|nr:hypothetical protein O6H91_07G055500 [Diphasiastrum complanatum]